MSTIRTLLATVVGMVLVAPLAAVADHATCDATLTGPRLGRHSRTDASADAVLWPPNHKLHEVSISAQNDAGDACDVTITDVRQDEAPDGVGSGNTDPDAANCRNDGTTSRVSLRAERSGTGDGRYYHIVVTMSDPAADGHTTVEDLLVLVPHDQGVKKTWTDQGPLFGSSSAGPISCTA